jgi:hypothetical protein
MLRDWQAESIPSTQLVLNLFVNAILISSYSYKVSQFPYKEHFLENSFSHYNSDLPVAALDVRESVFNFRDILLISIWSSHTTGSEPMQTKGTFALRLSTLITPFSHFDFQLNVISFSERKYLTYQRQTWLPHHAAIILAYWSRIKSVSVENKLRVVCSSIQGSVPGKRTNFCLQPTSNHSPTRSPFQTLPGAIPPAVKWSKIGADYSRPCYKPEGRGIYSRWSNWKFSLTESFGPHYGPGVDSAPNINEYQEYFMEGVKAAGA